MVRKQPEVTEATRRAFIGAYCQLQMESPGSVVTVRSITERAGYNRTTFYRYFQDIPAVLEWIENNVIATVLESIGRAETVDDPMDGLVRAFASLSETHVMQLGVLFSPTNRSRFTEKLKRAVTPIYAQRLSADLKDPHVRALFDMFFSAIFSQIATWFGGESSLSSDEVLALNRSLFEGWLVPQLEEQTDK